MDNMKAPQSEPINVLFTIQGFLQIKAALLFFFEEEEQIPTWLHKKPQSQQTKCFIYNPCISSNQGMGQMWLSQAEARPPGHYCADSTPAQDCSE